MGATGFTVPDRQKPLRRFLPFTRGTGTQNPGSQLRD
jgi:hypothetical protein